MVLYCEGIPVAGSGSSIVMVFLLQEVLFSDGILCISLGRDDSPVMVRV